MGTTLIGAIKYLPVRKVNRIVIAALTERPGDAELLMVSDEEEDFVPVRNAFVGNVFVQSVNEMIDYAKRWYEGLPFSMVVISHSNMTEQEAYSVIMGKNVDIPPKKVLRKRHLQWLYWDCTSDKWKKDAERGWQEDFGCDEPLWDGSESVFSTP